MGLLVWLWMFELEWWEVDGYWNILSNKNKVKIKVLIVGRESRVDIWTIKG